MAQGRVHSGEQAVPGAGRRALGPDKGIQLGHCSVTEGR